VKIVRRYGISPADRCTGQSSCPAVLALDNGDYLIIGKAPGVPNISARELAQHGAGIGPGEQAIILPADVLHAAARAIAEEQQRPSVAS
jgi:hypothetical protein